MDRHFVKEYIIIQKCYPTRLVGLAFFIKSFQIGKQYLLRKNILLQLLLQANIVIYLIFLNFISM